MKKFLALAMVAIMALGIIGTSFADADRWHRHL